MRRAFANSLLCLLLFATVVWGGCVSCEQYFMVGGAKGCCSPNGHCKTKSAPSSNSERECRQIAFDHEKQLDFYIDLPAVPVAGIEWPAVTSETPERRREALIEPSPPDLHILYSTFLI